MKSDEELRMPFDTVKIRRRAGQSVGEKWRAKVDNTLESLVPWMMLGFAFFLVAWVEKLKVVIPLWLGIVVLILSCVVVVCKYFKLIREIRTWKQGEKGEQYVGQILDRELSASGYKVYHDIVLKAGGREMNIDHLLVGANGVFLVETKTWRKPVKGHADVSLRDGVLWKGDKPVRNPDPVREVRALSKRANEYFKTLTGLSYYVKPIIVVAGWYAKASNRNESPILLLNEKVIANFLPKHQPQQIPDPRDIQLLIAKLDACETI